jgi:hypothetical protein
MRRCLPCCVILLRLLLLALLAGCTASADPLEQPHRLSGVWVERMFSPEHMAEDTAKLMHDLRRMLGGEMNRMPPFVSRR